MNNLIQYSKGKEPHTIQTTTSLDTHARTHTHMHNHHKQCTVSHHILTQKPQLQQPDTPARMHARTHGRTLWEPGLARANSGYTNWKRAVRHRCCGEQNLGFYCTN